MGVGPSQFYSDWRETTGLASRWRRHFFAPSVPPRFELVSI